MKKSILLITLVVMLFAVTATLSAGTYSAIYPDGNTWMSWDRFSWNLSDNVQFYFNNDNDTVGATILDSDGYPLVYYWFDLYSSSYDAYISYDGSTWTYLGLYYY